MRLLRHGLAGLAFGPVSARPGLSLEGGFQPADLRARHADHTADPRCPNFARVHAQAQPFTRPVDLFRSINQRDQLFIPHDGAFYAAPFKSSTDWMVVRQTNQWYNWIVEKPAIEGATS